MAYFATDRRGTIPWPPLQPPAFRHSLYFSTETTRRMCHTPRKLIYADLFTLQKRLTSVMATCVCDSTVPTSAQGQTDAAKHIIVRCGVRGSIVHLLQRRCIEGWEWTAAVPLITSDTQTHGTLTPTATSSLLVQTEWAKDVGSIVLLTGFSLSAETNCSYCTGFTDTYKHREERSTAMAAVRNLIWLVGNATHEWHLRSFKRSSKGFAVYLHQTRPHPLCFFNHFTA